MQEMIILNKQKILIVSRWYSPVNNPRAFRTTELLDELIKRNKYDVSAILPSFADISKDKLEAVFLPAFSMPSKVDDEGRIEWRYRLTDLIRQIIRFFFGESLGNMIYAVRVYFALKKLLKKNKYDAVISISYPFFVNISVALATMKFNANLVKIADCGDPFYDNPAYRKASYLKWVEKKILQCFDYVVIPIKEAQKSYVDYEISKKIKIIPQGFAIENIAARTYKQNIVPTFCFAGVFYEKIRNPEYFLEYLSGIKNNFLFIVYALPDAFTQEILTTYKKKLGNKLEIRKAVPRKGLIHIMAKMDFVLNFDNENNNQRPSKLIDYAMSKRPILSFNSKTFEPAIFEEFLRGNYSRKEQIDLTQYDIRNVVDKFEILFNRNDYKRGELI
mgnify:CR=1 FL=1